MTEITKCLNEWNATIEALGQAKQTILIRKYNTTLKEFLLYPTKSYTIKNNYLDSFKEEEKRFVKKYSLPNIKNKKVEVKYYAKIEEIKKVSKHGIGRYDPYHIWTKKHVSSYIHNPKAYLWILRVYELETPQYLSRTNGIRYANVDKKINLTYNKPVISDKEFYEIKNEILSK